MPKPLLGMTAFVARQIQILQLKKPKTLIASRYRENLFFSVRFKDEIEPSYDISSGGAFTHEQLELNDSMYGLDDSTDCETFIAQSTTKQGKGTVLADLVTLIEGCLGECRASDASCDDTSQADARDVCIVYTFKKSTADLLAHSLKECGLSARSYHRCDCVVLPTSQIAPCDYGLCLFNRSGSKQREDILQSWLRGDTRVIVATIAFGMGIDHAGTLRELPNGLASRTVKDCSLYS